MSASGPPLPGSGGEWVVTRVNVTGELVRGAWGTAAVREALAAKAREVQARAEQIAASEGVELDAEVVEMTRPRGRPEARVQSANAAQEWGDSRTPRRRILGRAAEG